MFSRNAISIITYSSREALSKMGCLNLARKYTTTTVPSNQAPTRMEKTINGVQLLGRVGADPQMKGTTEHPVVVFSLATHSNYRYESGDFLQRTEWHRVICFKPGLRETVMNYLKKGQRVYVTGRITYGEIKDEEGKARSTTAVQAEDVIFFHSDSTKASS